ncbi:MAG: B12-binding domain-containing radical SAM protein [Candidatus Tectomicrobia bacterium]|nr:B12-binding domain-containing radical SAM protein [Candidatus Tectomicrobia bacterium]
MNILLIHPSKKVLDKKDDLHGRESLTPSLGLAALAAYLREKGVEVKIIDLRLPHRTMNDVFQAMEELNPTFIGITAFTNEISAAGEVARQIKAHHPNAFVVIGGPHVSTIPLETLREFESFDVGVVGEGEETAFELLEAFMGRDLTAISGLVLRRGGEIFLTAPRKPLKDLNQLPFPAWDLFEIESYSPIFLVSTSRGCPYPCYFCNPRYLGQKTRIRHFLNVVDEIEILVKRFGAKRIQFADATLSLLGRATSQMCDELIRRGLHRSIAWDCETRADSIDEPLLKKMKEAGCEWIALGVETGSERILRDIVKKGETREEIREAVRLAKRAGIKVRCFFILGHYTETVETIRETISFAKELNPDALSFGLMVPNPGSEIRVLAEEGKGGLRLLHSRWGEYNQFHYSCFESQALPLEELKKWQSIAYFSFYASHPLKALRLFLDQSAYNYTLKSLLTIPWSLARNLFTLTPSLSLENSGMDRGCPPPSPLAGEGRDGGKDRNTPHLYPPPQGWRKLS